MREEQQSLLSANSGWRGTSYISFGVGYPTWPHPTANEWPERNNANTTVRTEIRLNMFPSRTTNDRKMFGGPASHPQARSERKRGMR